MFEVPPAKWTMELHSLFTYSNVSINWLAVLRSRRLKCFNKFDFPLVFGTRAYSTSPVSAMFTRKSALPSGNFGTFRCAFQK